MINPVQHSFQILEMNWTWENNMARVTRTKKDRLMIGGPYAGKCLRLTTSGTLIFKVLVDGVKYYGRYDFNNVWVPHLSTNF